MRVTIINEGRRFALRADDRPYTIHGVGMSSVSPTQTTHLLEALVDELQYRWTGSYPEQRAPRATGIALDGKPAGASVRLASGDPAHVCVALDSTQIDTLEFVWELRREVEQRSTGGHAERPAERVPLQRIPGRAESPLCLTFHTPQQPGEYRVFVQINDRYNGAATANLPFLVDAALK